MYYTINATVKEVKEWFEDVGYKVVITDDGWQKRLKVSDKRYNASTLVDYSEEGLTFGWSNRKIRQKATAQRKVQEEIDKEISRYKLRNAEKVNRERVICALSALGVDFTGYGAYAYGYDGRAKANFDISDLDYFKECYKDSKTTDSLSLTFYINSQDADDITLNYKIDAQNTKVLALLENFLKKAKDNFWACGI